MAENGFPLDPRFQANMLDLTSMATERTARTEPIHQAAMAMAQHMAPGYAQAAMTATKPLTDPNTIKTGISTGTNSGAGGGAGATAGFLASLLSALAAGGAGGGGNLANLINLFRRRGGGRDTVQGNRPYPGGALQPGNPYDPTDYFTGWAPPDQQRQPTPNVDTSYTTGFDPNTLFGNGFDPNNPANWDLLYGLFNGMPNDPSGGSGVGPGMAGFRGGGGGGDFGPDDWWNHP